jgi:glycosyltransferase involved in cell wall biosynthesis
MKVLLVHNQYQRPGGEDQVFMAEGALLEAKGHEVLRYTAHNDQVQEMAPLALAGKTVWNRAGCGDLRSLVRRERPDVAHFHNTFPLISPAAYYAVRKERVPVVQTLHNYRLLCPGGLLMREGRVCEDCVGRAVAWRGAARGCYRESRAASGVTTAMLAAHSLLGTWSKAVDVYIALTEFGRRKFIEGRLPAQKIVVKPNFVESNIKPTEEDGHELSERRGDYALFVGRLSAEKGLRTLLEAWRRVSHVPLKIVGDGPLMSEVRAAVQTVAGAGRVELLGQQGRAEVLSLMRGARFVVVPSEWYETFGLTIIEAFACGVPVIASRLGAMLELVEDGRTGLHFAPGDAADLAGKIEWAWENAPEMKRMGREARREYETKYTAARNYEMLMSIYERASLQSAAQNKER